MDGLFLDEVNCKRDSPLICKRIVSEIVEVVSRWEDFAKETDVDQAQMKKIKKSHRLHF